MYPLNYDWIDGTTSIIWECDHIGIVRFHTEESTLERPEFRGSCMVKVCDGVYEFKALVCSPAPTFSEHRAVKGYLKRMGLTGFERRLKNGRVLIKSYGGDEWAKAAVSQSSGV